MDFIALKLSVGTRNTRFLLDQSVIQEIIIGLCPLHFFAPFFSRLDSRDFLPNAVSFIYLTLTLFYHLCKVHEV